MVFHSAERNYKTHRRRRYHNPLNRLNPHAEGVSKGRRAVPHVKSRALKLCFLFLFNKPDLCAD
jgi:hypothetical protein